MKDSSVLRLSLDKTRPLVPEPVKESLTSFLFFFIFVSTLPKIISASPTMSTFKNSSSSSSSCASFSFCSRLLLSLSFLKPASVFPLPPKQQQWEYDIPRHTRHMHICHKKKIKKVTKTQPESLKITKKKKKNWNPSLPLSHSLSFHERACHWTFSLQVPPF